MGSLAGSSRSSPAVRSTWVPTSGGSTCSCIRVNAIAPGWIETDMTDVLGPMLSIIAAQTPIGRLGQPDDIAWAAVYLASDEANFVTGQVLSPNGAGT